MKICSVPECGREHHARGLCNGHWQRLRRIGNSNPTKPFGTSNKGRTPQEALAHLKGNTTPSPTGCWLWKGCCAQNGYGHVGYKGKIVSVHRLMWKLINGEISADLDVLHKCDCRRCCNPEHLFLGTASDNLMDASRKGRLRVNGKHPTAKLSAEQVISVRQQLREGVAGRLLAKQYGVSYPVIFDIRRRRRYRHI